MPVIRGEATFKTLQKKTRRELVRQLAGELSGPAESNGPIVFEIPLGQTHMKDVLVIWDKFRDVGVEERTEIIMDAYRQAFKETNDIDKTISLAAGLTCEDAWEATYLPYVVEPAQDVELAQVKDALVAEGALVLPAGKVQLHLPTRVMAEAAVRRLRQKFPDANWHISESAALSC